MVSRAPILHTYALTSLNYWKWDHPQLWCVPLPCREGRLHGGIAPATKASSGSPCPTLSCRLPGRQTLRGLISLAACGLGSMQPGRYQCLWSRGAGSARAQVGATRAALWICTVLSPSHFTLTHLQFTRSKGNFSLKHWCDSACLGYVWGQVTLLCPQRLLCLALQSSARSLSLALGSGSAFTARCSSASSSDFSQLRLGGGGIERSDLPQ